ncbi:TolC family protein [Flavobacterium sp.]|uniref:TolC family protein n=1 Tax=Flavobacterium sp. TaxID=239 RepID=UPI0025C585EA|nr:TolC family protein [Flavobacterium sp.]
MNMYSCIQKRFFFLLLVQLGFGQTNKEIKKLEELIISAKEQNISIKNQTLQTDLAALTKKTAKGNILNPRIPSTAQVINNFNQQVSFLPGPIFGQPEGTFKAVTMGQQYVSTFSIQPQIDVVNPGTIALLKSATLNEELIKEQNKWNEQTVYNQINNLYFNILLLKKQQQILEENKKTAEQIVTINQNKFKEGLLRKQELNEAESNLIAIDDKLIQLELTLKIQMETLQTYYNQKDVFLLKEDLDHYAKEISLLESKNNIKTKISELQYESTVQDVKVAQWSQLPILTLISSFNWQNQSNITYFDPNSNWVNYNYIGLKLSWDFPTTIQKISTIYAKKIQAEQLKNNAEQAAKENDLMNKQWVLEYEKAIQQFRSLEKIYVLKKDTFEKNKNQYDEQILPLDKLLISHNDLINSELNLASALATIGYTKYRIIIYNN